ncbi:hypothetical protein AAIR98_000902 [Elusimicrobium simillimum]|uniref:DUF4054 domain-containing protein n=1 Tax=Elusimicrobium simillimum TaxID=3143438 RepID=UPI003C6EDDEF
MTCPTPIPVTVEEFKDYFDRDFPYASDESDMTQIRNKDIQKAFGEAQMNFNESLFSCPDDIKRAFLYLAAHYLVVDISNSTSGLAGRFQGYMTSKSVGSVSAGYQIPQWILDNPIYSMLGQTVYGIKYLSLIVSQTVGNFGIVKGATSP